MKFLVDHLLGNRFVRRQHEFLDHLVALGVLRRGRTADFSVFVQFDFDFGDVHIDRPAIHTTFTKHHGQRVHVANDAEDIGLQFLLPRFVVLQVFVDLFVGKTMGAFDYASM